MSNYNKNNLVLIEFSPRFIKHRFQVNSAFQGTISFAFGKKESGVLVKKKKVVAQKKNVLVNKENVLPSKSLSYCKTKDFHPF